MLNLLNKSINIIKYIEKAVKRKMENIIYCEMLNPIIEQIKISEEYTTFLVSYLIWLNKYVNIFILESEFVIIYNFNDILIQKVYVITNNAFSKASNGMNVKFSTTCSLHFYFLRNISKRIHELENIKSLYYKYETNKAC